MSHEWFRLHNDFINDPKMRRYFSKSERLDWVNLLCLSSKSKQRGTIALPDDEIAYALDLEDDEWLTLRDKFVERRMVEIRADGTIAILNWDKHHKAEYLSGYRIHQEEIFKRDEYACVYCGSTQDLTLDHIIPQSRGGSHDPDNICTACRLCNSSKGARTPEEWMATRVG